MPANAIVVFEDVDTMTTVSGSLTMVAYAQFGLKLLGRPRHFTSGQVPVDWSPAPKVKGVLKTVDLSSLSIASI